MNGDQTSDLLRGSPRLNDKTYLTLHDLNTCTYIGNNIGYGLYKSWLDGIKFNKNNVQY